MRLDYDEARLAHHARLLTVATSTIQQVISEGRRLQYLNRHADAGRCGLILSGPATEKATQPPIKSATQDHEDRG